MRLRYIEYCKGDQSFSGLQRSCRVKRLKDREAKGEKSFDARLQKSQSATSKLKIHRPTSQAECNNLLRSSFSDFPSPIFLPRSSFPDPPSDESYAAGALTLERGHRLCAVLPMGLAASIEKKEIHQTFGICFLFALLYAA